MKNVLPFIFLFTFFVQAAMGQNDSISVITATSYLDDPMTYLSNISGAKIPSGILIDRTRYDSLILNVNGTSKVTTISSTSWIELYNHLKYTSNSATMLDTFEIFNEVVEDHFEATQTYSIGILDFKFNRLKQSAVDNGELIQGVSYAQDISLNPNSFSNERAVIASCLVENIQGDVINFIVSSFFYQTNVQNETLQSIEIDFDDGSGYRPVEFDEQVTISYGTSSGYLLFKVKLQYEDNITHQVRTYYAHSSVFRTGSATVPLPAPLPGASSSSGKINADREIFYPSLIKATFEECRRCGLQTCCRDVERVIGGGNLQVYILFAPGNASGKLRRPFIVTDGFDPGNKRDYYHNSIKRQKTPLSNDYRGLYQLLNGDPSPWYSGEPSANLVGQLRNDGYDIVIINFRDGTGDIPTNAMYLRAFLKNVLNSPAYRDNFTEEAVLVGPSMGGLITRYALKTMEQNNEPHYVKAWYSFDSPHRGAYIPMSLQITMAFFSKIATAGISKLENGKAQFKAARSILSTPAAKQMLVRHYLGTSGGKLLYNGSYDDDFNQFQQQLNALGYPAFSKNYAITNGGTGKLYEPNGSLIIAFKILPWTWSYGYRYHNSEDSHEVFEGRRRDAHLTVRTSDQIAFENSVGGWSGQLYALNLNPDNKRSWVVGQSGTVQGLKAAFINTSSAFGIPVTRENVYKTWQDYQASNTPFDEIKGMDVPTSEEHVRISPLTAQYFISKLREDFSNTTRPRVRTGEVLNESVVGPIAYVIKESIIFAGSGNSYTVENSGNIKIISGGSIKLSPGFLARPGSVVSATIGPVEFSSQAGRGASYASTALDLSEQSPYAGKVYEYSVVHEESSITSTSELSVFPNPTNGMLQVSIPGGEGVKVLEVFNSIGVLIRKTQSILDGAQEVDLSFQPPGVYSIRVTSVLGKVMHAKVIKR